MLRNHIVGKQSEIGRFRATVCDRNLDQDVFDVSLGVLHEHIEVAIVIEHSGVEQFEFG